MNALRISEDQVLWFRARCGHLAGPGAATPAEAAAAVLGAQSQQLNTGLLALAQRTAGRPRVEALRGALFGERRTLVRTWGQRDTVHLYDVADWPDVVAARAQWAGGGRRGAMPPETDVDEALRILQEAGGPVTRSDVVGAISEAFLEEAIEKWVSVGGSRDDAERFAGGRLLWQLNNRGDACIADSVEREQSYALRARWLPDLEWPESLDAETAATRLARRHLAVNGPATAQDLAHFFNARMTEVRRWIERLEEADELIEVRCGDRDGLMALAEDEDALREKAPGGWSEWPLRLLPLWDTLLMSHADKSWTVPDESERKAVWRPAAMVSAAVLARGRVVATWKQKALTRLLRVTVEPLSGWRQAHLPGVRREAADVAAHLGLEETEVTVDPPGSG